MYGIIASDQIHLPPGAVVCLPATWHDYLSLCEGRGSRSIPRIKYRQGQVWLMSPLPKHGRVANFLADLVKVLLDHQGRHYEAFTPITLEHSHEASIEPDYCFYIDHCSDIIGKDRFDWEVDPPPDLVIEVDVTSYSNVNDYLPLQVPEVWIFKREQLLIYALQPDQSYQPQSSSRFFPNVDLDPLVRMGLQIAAAQGTGVAIQILRQRLEPIEKPGDPFDQPPKTAQ